MIFLPVVAALSLSSCPSTAFVTLERGRIAGVTWTKRSEQKLELHTKLSQTLIIDSTISVRPDGSTSHAESERRVWGSPPSKPVTRDLPAGSVFWSDTVTATLEQVVLRARAGGQAKTEFAGASMWGDVKVPLQVERLDPTDWVVTVNRRHYDVLTDTQGCLVSATLPDYGILIERWPDYEQSQYPLWTPYGPPPDGAYSATDVKIPAPQGHVLAGTFVHPKGTKRVPAVVFITGISDHERNCGNPPFMPFRDLSDALARAGIASIRVDDRGIFQSTGDRSKFTIQDKADDTQTQVAWLRARKDIDPKKIFLLGYSEGGTVGPMVAGRDPTIAGLVSMSGNGVLPDVLNRYQTEIAVMDDPSVPAADKQKEIEKELAEPLDPHAASFMKLDPIEVAKQVKCPALLTQGGNDLHVPPRSAQRLAEAMRSNGNSDVTVRVFPGMGHMIVPDPIGLARFWPAVPAQVTLPDLQETIVGWFEGHAR